MATVTKTYACIQDARIYSGFGGSGAGADDKLPIGLASTGLLFRALGQFYLPNWKAENVRRVVSAKVRIYNSVPEHIARGASPRLLQRRATAAWKEGSSAVLSGSNGGGVTWNNQPFATAVGQTDSGVIATANNATIEIDATAQVRAWAPTTVESGLGQTNYGLVWIAFNEAAGSATTEFWSSESSKKPVLIVTWETNTAPTAPIDLVPAANADGTAAIFGVVRDKSVSVPGTTLVITQRGIFGTFSGTRVDPDAGDSITGVQIAVHADGATDGTPGAALVDQTFTDFAGTPTTFSRSVTLTALTIGTSYRARVRTRDKDGVWGAWSSFTAMRFKPNTLPLAPANLAVDTATQTPNFYGSIVDPDPGAAWSEVQLEVMQDTTAGTIAKWQPGYITTGGTRFVIPYGGASVIEFDTPYRFRARGKDNLGSEGPWSAWVYWIPKQVFGPDNMTPRSVETKQNTLTPNLTIAHSANFDAHELEVARYSDGSSILWDVPVTTYASTASKVVAYAGASLNWGPRTYWWRAKIRVGGVTWTEWSPWYPFYVNALPDKPVLSVSA